MSLEISCPTGLFQVVRVIRINTKLLAGMKALTVPVRGEFFEVTLGSLKRCYEGRPEIGEMGHVIGEFVFS